jgi:hypothetical protein
MRASSEGLGGARGEVAVEDQFLALNWGVAKNPREHDLGTDLWLMARDARRFDLGALVGAQAKRGTSWFERPECGDSGEVLGWWHPDTDRHFKYWTEHRVPHILVLHDPDTKVSYWVHVTADKVVDTGKNSKILVPHHQTVDIDHVDQLLEVATGRHEHPGWEGSAWHRRVIAREDRLRYALLTPRLISPRPSAAGDALTPEEALAILVEMRVGELEPSPFPYRSTRAPNLEECRDSGDWWWQFYAATYDVLVGGHDVAELTSLTDMDKVEPFEQAAAAAVAAAIFVENGQPERGLELVNALIDADRCEPVDHYWLVMHSARCLSELGRLDEAQAQAIEVQGLRASSRNDPTAMSLVGASSGLIISTSWIIGYEPQGFIDAAAGRDTHAAWWRTQEVAWGLQHQADEDFQGWAKDTSVRFGASDQTWRHLRAASLISGLGADESAWRSIHAQLARRELTTSNGNVADVASALTSMRVAGDDDDIELAVDRLLQIGPVSAVRDVASTINLDEATRTSLLADIKFVEHAADVLDVVDADRHARWVIRVLRDPSVVTERWRPTFVVPIYVLQMFAEITAVVSAPVLREIIDYVTTLSPVTDASWGQGLARVVRRVPESAWTTDDLDKLESREGDEFQFEGAVTAVLAKAKPVFRQGLLTKIAKVHLPTLAAWGSIEDLPDATAAALACALAEKIPHQIAQLQGGRATFPPSDLAGTLACVNVTHPQYANWQPVVDFLRSRHQFPEYLECALHSLRRIGFRIPDDAAEQLEPVVHDLMTLARSSSERPDVRGAAASALATFRPDAISDTEFRDLLCGSGSQRAAAVFVIAARRQPSQIDLFASLALDVHPTVRATVANCLAYWVAQGVAAEAALALLERTISSSGTQVPRMIAAGMVGARTTASVSQLAALLQDSPSAYARSVSAQHLNGGPS